MEFYAPVKHFPLLLRQSGQEWWRKQECLEKTLSTFDWKIDKLSHRCWNLCAHFRQLRNLDPCLSWDLCFIYFILTYLLFEQVTTPKAFQLLWLAVSSDNAFFRLFIDFSASLNADSFGPLFDWWKKLTPRSCQREAHSGKMLIAFP